MFNKIFKAIFGEKKETIQTVTPVTVEVTPIIKKKVCDLTAENARFTFEILYKGTREFDKCDHCGMAICYSVVVKDQDGQTYNIGYDCSQKHLAPFQAGLARSAYNARNRAKRATQKERRTA